MLKLFLVEAAGLFLTLDGRDVCSRHDQPAFCGPSLGNLNPPAVHHLGFPLALGTVGGWMLLTDGQPGETIDIGPAGARLEQLGLQVEKISVVAIAQKQSPIAIPQDKGLGNTFDGVPQPDFGGLRSCLGQALFGHVERDADDPAVVLAICGLKSLSPGIDPQRPPTVATRDAERDIEGAEGGGMGQRLSDPIAMIRSNSGQDFLSADRAGSAPAEDHGRHIGHDHAIRIEIPLPDTASGSLHRQSEPLLAVHEGLLGALGAPALQHEQQRKGDPYRQRGQQGDQSINPLAADRTNTKVALGIDGQQLSVGDGLHGDVQRRAAGRLTPDNRPGPQIQWRYSKGAPNCTSLLNGDIGGRRQSTIRQGQGAAGCQKFAGKSVWIRDKQEPQSPSGRRDGHCRIKPLRFARQRSDPGCRAAPGRSCRCIGPLCC